MARIRFPIYGLASYDTCRTNGGAGWESRRPVRGDGITPFWNRDPTAVSLIHETGDGEVEVISSRYHHPVSLGRLMLAVHPERRSQVRSEDDLAALAAEAEEIRFDLPVDGTTVTFVGVSDGGRWSLQAESSEHLVRIHARDVDPGRISLVTVTDLRPYVAGDRRVLAADDES